MKISVFGLGYVGTTNAACLANKGHEVIGVDIKSWKVRVLNEGWASIKETELEAQIQEAINKGLLHAATDARMAIFNSCASLICVGTPSAKNNDVYLNGICRAVEDLGMVLKEKNDYHLVVLRSTIPPGTTENIVIPLLRELSGKEPGIGFGICVNPEFLREGSMVEDFLHPELTVIGELDKRSGDVLTQMYQDFSSRTIRTDIRTAEMVKYAFNAFHALKISFANEMGNICAEYGVNPDTISEILCADHKLNISPRYLRPGFAFGGSCLPKDLQALIFRAKQKGYIPHLLESVIKVNEFQKEKGIALAREMMKGEFKGKKIAIIGVAFKENSDDVRGSPAVFLIEKLLNSGATVVAYDPLALENLERLFREEMEYASTIEGALKNADLTVITLRYVDGLELKRLLNLARERQVLDLVGIGSCDELQGESNVDYRYLF
jgi:nucleotide sugar dehydrogenase